MGGLFGSCPKCGAACIAGARTEGARSCVG